MKLSSHAAVAVLMAGAVALVAGCGGGGSSTASTTAGAGAARALPVKKLIRHNWVEFFNPATPTSRRVALLQHGGRYRHVIAAEAKSPRARHSRTTVSRVRLTGPDKAAVRYTVLVGGKPALKHRAGTAVKSAGTWKVSDRSFCALLHLNGSNPSACSKG